MTDHKTFEDYENEPDPVLAVAWDIVQKAENDIAMSELPAELGGVIAILSRVLLRDFGKEMLSSADPSSSPRAQMWEKILGWAEDDEVTVAEGREQHGEWGDAMANVEERKQDIFTCQRCNGTGKPEGWSHCFVCEGTGLTWHQPHCHAAYYSTGVCTCEYEPPSSEQNRTGRAFELPDGRTRAVAAATEAVNNLQGNGVNRRAWLARRAIDAALAEGGVVGYEEHQAMVTAKDDWKEAQEITNEQRKAAEARVRELEEERDKLRQAIPDPDSLDSIAGWFEVRYRGVAEIQQWCRVLRTSARLARDALEESETQEGSNMSASQNDELCGAYHPRGACNPCELFAGHWVLHAGYDNQGREYQWSYDARITDPKPIGRDSAVDAAAQAIAEAADEFAASPEVFAELAVDAALANGGVVVRQELENMVDTTTESVNRRIEDLKRRVSIVVDSTFGVGVRNEDLKNRLLTVINQTLDTWPGLRSGCGYIATECRCSSLNLD